MVKVGRNSILFNNVYIASSGTVSGKKEHDGPLGKYIDKYYEDSHAGCDSWEKSEQKMLNEAVKIEAAKIILIHNHPTGDSTPSQQDLRRFK